MTDLAVSIVGAEPTTDWSIFGIRESSGQGIMSLAAPFVVLGSPTGNGYRTANAAFYRVKLTGEVSNDPLYGYNTYNGIFSEGFAGPDLQPLKGSFIARNSMFDAVASAVPVVNLRDSRVSISGNTMNNVMLGGEVSDLENTVYDYVENNVMTASVGVQMYDTCLGAQSNCGMQGSELAIRSDVFRATDGVLIDATFSGGTTARILANDFTGVSGLGVGLGPGTSHCLVVLKAPTTVEDLGTDNVVVGHKHASGKR